MKRSVAMILALLMSISLLSGCGNRDKAPAEGRELKVLTIGNAQAVDVTRLLYAVFGAEAPGCKLVLGTLEGEDYTMQQHRQSIEDEITEYTYHKNTDGNWQMSIEYTVLDALQDEKWDVVILQEKNTLSGKDIAFTNNDIRFVMDYVKEQLGYDPTFLWHFVWSDPVEDMWLSQSKKPNYLEQWRAYYEKNFQNDDRIMFDAMASNVQTYIREQDSGFAGVVSTAAAIQYLKDVSDLPEQLLFRDYTHLSDEGRLAAAYVLYGCLSGLEAVEAVQIDRIPANLRHYTAQGEGDLMLSDDFREQIKAAANYALQNPTTAPAQ